MPVSKKRVKPKRRSASGVNKVAPLVAPAEAPAKGGLSTLLPKNSKKLSKQQIIFYVISILVVLSMAIGYLVGNSAPSVPAPTATSAASTPAPTGQSGDSAAPAAQPTTQN